jgi:hypothetical protein
MGVLDKLLGGAAAQPIEAVGNVLDKLFTSEEEKLDKQALLTKLAQQPNLAQVELNKVEAQHRSTFVAGARPFILWVCGFGLANSFIVNPWIQWITNKPGPVLPLDVMSDLVIAMLGLGALRTVEKLQGRAK